MILVVTYDLKQPAASYTELFDTLKSRESWAHYISATWLVATDESPKELSKALTNLIYEGDRMLIFQLTPAYYGWMPRKAWEWIRRHL